MFETVGGEEELSFSCRVKGGAARAATSKKQGAKRPANQRRKERARRRRKAWEERRRVSATADAATATAAAGAATIEVATAAARGGGAANPLSVVAGAAVLAAPVNTEVKKASAAATAALAEEVTTSATAVVTVAAVATAAVLQGAKVAVWERRTSARAQILARRRESAEVLRSPDPVVSELEISWASREREELECTKSVKDEDVMDPERGTATTTPHPWGRILCTICCAQYHTWCYAYCKSCSIERKSKP
jgi:hypothetical protein